MISRNPFPSWSPAWCSAWQLSVNIDKCRVLHLGFNNLLVQYTYNTICSDATTVCDLGVNVDSSQKYDGYNATLIVLLPRHIHASVYCSMVFSIVIFFFYT